MPEVNRSFFDEIVELLNGKCPSYQAIFSYPSFICDMRQQINSDFNVFIPVRGRMSVFESCVRYMTNAAERSNTRISVFIIENDAHPQYRTLAANLRVSYIFIPVNVSSSDGLFAKALCFNVGFILSKKVKWNIFHDLDILVDADFFEKLKIHVVGAPTWIQPYKGHSIQRLSLGASEMIMNNPKITYNLSMLGGSRPMDVGSPGGSIVVKDSDFIEIGGYDPEFFYGRSPEDYFLWIKLEILHKDIIEVMNRHIQGSAFYANDPPIDVYAMDYPFDYEENSNIKTMQYVLKYFYVINNIDRKYIIRLKKSIMIDILSKRHAYDKFISL